MKGHFKEIEIQNDRLDKVPVPTWALGYIFNAEVEGLSEREIITINKWWEEEGIEAMDCPEEEPYFTYFPPFGLACEVVDCVILRRKK